MSWFWANNVTRTTQLVAKRKQTVPVIGIKKKKTENSSLRCNIYDSQPSSVSIRKA